MAAGRVACAPCAAPLPSRARFCPRCGAPIGPGTGPAPGARPGARLSRLLVVVVALGAAGAAALVGSALPEALGGLAGDDIDLPERGTTPSAGELPVPSPAPGAAPADGGAARRDGTAATAATAEGSRTGFELSSAPLGSGDGPGCSPDDCSSWRIPVDPGVQVWLTGDGTLLTATGSRVVAVEGATGSGRWQAALPPGGSGEVSLAVADDEVVIERGGRVQLRSLTDGSARWPREVELGTIVEAEAVDELVLVGTRRDPELDGPAVVGLERATGEVRFRVAVDGPRQPALRVEDGAVAVRTSRDRIVGIDPDDGRTTWVRAGRVVFTDAAVLIAADDGRAERLRLDQGGSGAPVSTALADVRADGPWTAVNDTSGTTRLVDQRGRVRHEQPGTTLSVAGSDEGIVLAIRVEDELVVRRYLDGAGVSEAVELDGGVRRWGLRPGIGLDEQAGSALIIAENQRTLARIERFEGDGLEAAIRAVPMGTSTLASDTAVIEVGSGATAVADRDGEALIDGRVTGYGRLPDGGLIVRTSDGLLLLDGDRLRRG